jgi:hypothetical protein
MSPHDSGRQTDLPPASSARLIAFDRADVISPMIYPPKPVLVVSGRKPYPMTVELVPLRYVRRPEYWGIEVVGRISGAGGPTVMPAITNIPYVVELDLAGSVGTFGIEVIGAEGTEQIRVSVADNTQLIGSVDDSLFHPMLPADLRGQALKLTRADVKDKIAPDAREVDLTPYNGSLLRIAGQHEGEWIYSAVVLEHIEADSILATVARHVLTDRPA